MTYNEVHRLAKLYREWGRPEKAEPFLLEALEARRRLLGDTHPDTLDTMIELARLRAVEGEAADALRLLREAVELGLVEPTIIDDPELLSLHGQPEFEEIVARVGLTTDP